MQFLRGIRWQFVLLVSACSLVLLLGGWLFYQRQYITGNAQNKLERIPGMVKAEVVKNQGETLISLELGEVPDLQQTYRNVLSVLAEFGDPARAIINITDQQDQTLVSIWSDSQFEIYQAIAQGTYVDMSKSIEEKAKQAGLDFYSVQMDWDFIFIQLRHGSNYLYKVVPRRPAESKQYSAVIEGGGGG